MTAEEQRKILEEIARNEDNYPRDRFAAVRALGDLEADESEVIGVAPTAPPRPPPLQRPVTLYSERGAAI